MQLLDPNGPAGMGGIIKDYPFIAEVVNFSGEKLMRGGPLPQLECEYIAMQMSAANGCEYCYGSHFATFDKLAGEAFVEAIAWERRNIFDLVVGSVKERKPVEDYILNKAETIGMSKDEVMHALSVAGAFCFYNAMVTGVGGRRASSNEFELIGTLLSTRGYMVDGSNIS